MCEGEPDLDIAEELLADALGVERHKGIRESAHLLDVEVGPALERQDLRRFEPADEVGRSRQHGPDGRLWVRHGIGAQDEVIQVRLWVGIRVAIECDRQLVDAGDLERSSADGANAAEVAGHDLRWRHAVEEVLGDDPHAQRERKTRTGGFQREHHLVQPAGGDSDLAPESSARLLVLEVLQNAIGEKNVVDRERLAVGPAHTGANVERICEVVVGDRPIGGEEPDHVLPRIDRGEPLVDDAVDVARAVVALEQGIEDPRLTDQGLHGRSAAGGLGHGRHRLACTESQRRRNRGDEDLSPTRGYAPLYR